MTQWVDFKELRRRIKIVEVLEAQGMRGKINNGQFKGFCPLPKHGAKPLKPTFSANVEKGIWKCFGCGASGNVLDLAVLLHNGDPKNTEEVRRIALQLSEQYPGEKRIGKPEQTLREMPASNPPAKVVTTHP